MDLDATMATMTDEPVRQPRAGDDRRRRRRGRAPVLRRPLHRQVAAGHRDHAGVADGRRGPGRRRARPLVHARHRDAAAAAGSRADGEARAARVLRRRRASRTARSRTSTSTGTRRRSSCRSGCSIRPGSRSPAPSRPRTCSIPGLIRSTSSSGRAASNRTVYNAAMRRSLPAGTVTFLFTDIEGSTRLLHALGPDAYAEALAEHRRLLRNAFAAHGGVEVDTQGDAFFVAFPTATGAADAACMAQDELGSGPISVRMGLHTGTPTVTDEGYVGVDVHRGARVGALAHGGQIVCSPATAALLDGHELRDLGSPSAQGLRRRHPALPARVRHASRRCARLGASTCRPPRPASSDASASCSRRSHSSTSATRGRSRSSARAEPERRASRWSSRDCSPRTQRAGRSSCALAPLRDADLVLPTIADRLGAGSADVGAMAPESATDARTSSATTSSTCCPMPRGRSASSWQPRRD